jgi:hypothetical protein
MVTLGDSRFTDVAELDTDSILGEKCDPADAIIMRARFTSGAVKSGELSCVAADSNVTV